MPIMLAGVEIHQSFRLHDKHQAKRFALYFSILSGKVR